MSLALLFHYLMLNMFRMLIHPSSEACDLFVELFHGLYCSGSMCVGVTLWFGWGGVVSGCRLQKYYFVRLTCASCTIDVRLPCSGRHFNVHSFIPSSVIRQVHCFFHSESSTEGDLVLPVSISGILSFP